jgi:PAS domain S-box-containing protein
MKPGKNSSSVRLKPFWMAALFVFSVMAVWAQAIANAQPPARPKRVVVLYWYDREFTGTSRWDQSFRAALQANASEAIECYSEYLEVNRFSGEQQSQALHDYLRRKYADHPIDVVVAQSQTSLDYLLKYRDDLFPNIPVVFYSMSRPGADQLAARPDITGLIVFGDYRKSLDLALGLHPHTEQVFIISGTLERNGHFEKIVRDELKDYENRVRINYLTDLPPDELISKTKSLPPRSIVLYIWQQSRNEQGKVLETADVFDSIVRTTPAPIYCMSGPIVDRGATGGYVYTIESSAAKTAEIVRRIASGERAQDIQIEKTPRVPMFNWRELRRWSISEDSLPPGSIIRNREQTVWDLHKWYIIGFISLLILEALLIAYLLVNRARRRRAEMERERFAQLAEAEHKHLNEIVSNVPGIVWESVFEHDTSTYQLTFISDYAEKMLGYTTEEWLSSESDLGRSFMLEAEDRDRVAHNSAAVIESGQEGLTQFRWRAKDGRILWAESSLSPIVDETGKIIGLRGVTVDVTEKHLAEEAKRESEERNRAILQAIPDLIFLQTRDGIYLDYHAQDPRELFASPEEYLGKNMRDILPPELVESHLLCFRQAEETGVPQVLEYELMVANELRWFEARIVYSDDKFLSVVRNITERKQTEKAIRFQAHLLNTIEQSVTATDLNGVVIFWNQFAERLYGWSPEEAVGRAVKDLLTYEDSEGQAEEIRSQLRKGQSWAGEFTLKNRDGDTLQIWSTASPIFDERENVIGMIGVSYDISERKRAENALRESESRLRRAQQAARVGTWEWDVRTGEAVWSEMVWELVGLVPDDAPTTLERFAEFVHPEDRDRARRKIEEVLAEGEEYYDEFRLVHRDGRMLWVSSRGRLIRSASGQPERMLGVNFDITERIRADESLMSALAEVKQLKDRLQEENIYLREEIKLEHNFSEIVGHSDAIKYVLHKIEQVAPTDSTVLIMGETGTGKELVARAIHSASQRQDRPLVKVNCAALYAGLIESELFGHEKGAFTGASMRKVGRFELAHGATIFLDEIGELPPELQVKLLRVIQEGEFERLGGNRTIKVAVRIIAATNRDLWKEVQKGLFREDLWYRLNVFPITTPPLRQRREDIPQLVEHFVSRFSKKLGKEITAVAPATLNALSHYSWPGNVRELANVIERAVINNDGSVLRLAHSLDSLQTGELSASKKTLEEIERDYIIAVLDETVWRIEGSYGAAKILGLHPSTLRTRMAKLKIQKPHPDVLSGAEFPARQRPS